MRRIATLFVLENLTKRYNNIPRSVQRAYCVHGIRPIFWCVTFCHQSASTHPTRVYCSHTQTYLHTCTFRSITSFLYVNTVAHSCQPWWVLFKIQMGTINATASGYIILLLRLVCIVVKKHHSDVHYNCF